VQSLLLQLERYGPLVAWSDGFVSVVELTAATPRSEAPPANAVSQ
jgi:hypothetical protein